jgi:hypothetical protein
MVVLQDDEDLRDQKTRDRLVLELARELAFFCGDDLRPPGTRDLNRLIYGDNIAD